MPIFIAVDLEISRRYCSCIYAVQSLVNLAGYTVSCRHHHSIVPTRRIYRSVRVRDSVFVLPSWHAFWSAHQVATAMCTRHKPLNLRGNQILRLPSQRHSESDQHYSSMLPASKRANNTPAMELIRLNFLATSYTMEAPGLAPPIPSSYT